MLKIMKTYMALFVFLLMSSSAFAWQQLPGAARDVGDGWVIGTGAEAGGYGIYRWNGSGWLKIPGGAVRIGGTYSNPWVVNNVNQIFRWTGATWQQTSGAATDVADGWIIGTAAESGGYGIYRWSGSSWDKMPGAAVRIGGTYNNPWVVNSANKIFRWTGSGWQQTSGAARDVGDSWVIGTGAEAGGYGIYRWNGSGWLKIPGSATNIGGAGGTPWIVNNVSTIYRY